MTITGLVSGLVVGGVAGTLSWLVWLVKGGVPVWVTVATGIVAALVGTVLAGTIGPGLGGLGLPELLAVQACLAGTAVTVVAVTARRHDHQSG